MIPLTRPLETENPLLRAMGGAQIQFSQSAANLASREIPTMGDLVADMTAQGTAQDQAERPFNIDKMLEENRYQTEAARLQEEMATAGPDEMPALRERLIALETDHGAHIGTETQTLMAAGRVQSPVVLAEKYQVPGLKFDRAMSDDEAKLIYEGRKADLIRQAIIAQSPSGFLPGVQRFGNSLIAMATDPLEVATMFIPAMGQAGKAAAVARFGNVGGRVVIGAVEGGIGNAMTEPAYALLSRSQQLDYTMSDSLMNIGAGFVLGGGLGAVAGLASRGAGTAPVARAEAQAPDIALRAADAAPEAPAGRADATEPLVLRQEWRARQDVARLADEQRPAADVAVRQFATGQAVEVGPVMPTEVSAVSLAGIESLAAEMRVSLGVSEGNGRVVLSKIVAEERGQGSGSQVMRALADYADATNQQMALTPSGDFGGSVARLRKFYKKFGFVENKGKNKDFGTRETMIRNPSPTQKPRPPASWVIKEKSTGAVIMETFDKRKVDALKTDRFEAVPIMRHLQELNASVAGKEKPEIPLAKHADADPLADAQAAQQLDDLPPYDQTVMTSHIADLEQQVGQLDEASLSADQRQDLAAVSAEQERYQTYAEVAQATAICLART